MSSILDSNAQARQRAESRIAWSPSAITSRPIRALRVFQTNVPVVEPKSTKVTILLKDGFGRVEDILLGEERLQVDQSWLPLKRKLGTECDWGRSARASETALLCGESVILSSSRWMVT
jgi:hypothetical protein